MLAACIAARWVRLECLSKRPGVDDEPFVLKELALLPLSSLAPFVDPASRRAADAPAEPSATSVSTPSPPPSPASPAERRLSAADEARARQLELLRGNFTFESVGIGGLDKELGQLFRRVLAPRFLGVVRPDEIAAGAGE